MGTSYYLKDNICAHCGRGDELLHIGKSSAGWCFSLHVIPERGIYSLDDWRREWSKPEVQIEDEYGRAVSSAEMESVITERGPISLEARPMGYPSWAAFHRENYSEDGPRGLLRHQIGPHCVGHGPGTWDLIPGEFS